MQAQAWGYRIVRPLPGITLVLVVVYLVVTEQNRSVQAEVNQRQQFINQSVGFSRVNDALARAVAAVAVNANDAKLRDLLTSNGIAINPKTGAPMPAAATGGNAGAAPAGKAP